MKTVKNILYLLCFILISCNTNAPDDKTKNEDQTGQQSNQQPDDLTHKDGVVDIEFSVSPTKKVKFSQGNLQYNAADNIWRFAENQCDRISDEKNSYVSEFYDGWIDEFGWATNGISNQKNQYATNCQPWSTAKEEASTSISTRFARASITIGTDRGNADYYLVPNLYGYGPSNVEPPHYNYPSSYDWKLKVRDSTDYDFSYFEGEQYDWGVNKISNGGNSQNQWRTLTKSEWDYLLQHCIYAYATLDGVKGMVLMSSDWQKPENMTFTKFSTKYQINSYNSEETEKLLKSNVVFIPKGDYWTATTNNNLHYINYDIATWVDAEHRIDLNVYYSCAWNAYYINGININTDKRYIRKCVRLVKDVQ